MRMVVNNGCPQGSAKFLAAGLAWSSLLIGSAAGQTNTDAWLWTSRGLTAAPAARTGVTAIWTGSQMLIWGGQLGGSSVWLTNGFRYNVASDSWSPMSLSNSPAPRYLHSAIWTGREMIIWGGVDAVRGGLACLNNGAGYDPVSDTWHPLTTVGAPRPRLQHTAVWTGKDMVVWGGNNYDQAFNDGGRYDPSSDTWKPLSTAGAPTARYSLTAVWTGQEMLVWGGNYLTVSGAYDFKLVYPSDMGRYNPNTDSWITNTPGGFPTLRADFSAVWDGAGMIVWGGYDGNTYGARTSLNNGGRFNPLNGTWTLMSTNQAPSGRDQHLAVWTGEEMIVWGGVDRTKAFRDGGRYHPTTDTWTVGTTNGAPASSYSGRAVWTEEAMLVYNNGLFAYYEPGMYAWDGLPNEWQRHFFGETNSQAAPFADPDGDGENNQLEYVAGTVPTDYSSRLEFSIQSSPNSSSQFDLTFKPWTGGRIYSVLAGTNLSGSTFTPMATAFTNNLAVSVTFSVTNTMHPSQFFRLKITLP